MLLPPWPALKRQRREIVFCAIYSYWYILASCRVKRLTGRSRWNVGPPAANLCQSSQTDTMHPHHMNPEPPNPGLIMMRAQSRARAPATTATSDMPGAFASSAAALLVTCGVPERVGDPVLLRPPEGVLGVGVCAAPEERAVSPAGMDMAPVTVDRKESVMTDTTDSDTGGGRGRPIEPLTEPVQLSACSSDRRGCCGWGRIRT